MNHLATIDHLNTDIGAVRVTASELGLLQVDLPGRQFTPGSSVNEATSPQAQQHAATAMTQILEYLGAKRRFFDLSIDWSMITPFQIKVLEITQFIPFGEILSYGQIAAKLGKINASRAVGGALGRNPMPIVIPCHRVVASNGNLTGFSAAEGILTKQWLLELEGHKIVGQNWINFFIMSLIWGTSFFWIKIGLNEVDPITLVFYRVGFATLGLVIFFLLTRKKFLLKFWWIYLFLAFFNVALPFILITWSETRISSGMASVMNSTQPLATALFAAIFIKEERLTPQRVLGLLVGFGGVVMLMSDRLNGGLNGQFIGILAMVVAILSYGGSSVFARLNNKGVSPESQALGQMSFGLIFLIPAMLTFESPVVLPKLPISYIAFAWLGLLGSFYASILWYKLLNEIGPSRVSMTTYLLPLIGISLGAVLLDEKIGWRLLAGGLLIILGIIIVNRKKVNSGSLTAATSQEEG